MVMNSADQGNFCLDFAFPEGCALCNITKEDQKDYVWTEHRKGKDHRAKWIAYEDSLGIVNSEGIVGSFPHAQKKKKDRRSNRAKQTAIRRGYIVKDTEEQSTSESKEIETDQTHNDVAKFSQPANGEISKSQNENLNLKRKIDSDSKNDDNHRIASNQHKGIIFKGPSSNVQCERNDRSIRNNASESKNETIKNQTRHVVKEIEKYLLNNQLNQVTNRSKTIHLPAQFQEQDLLKQYLHLQNRQYKHTSLSPRPVQNAFALNLSGKDHRVINVQRGQHTQNSRNRSRRELPGRVQAGHPLRDSDKDHHGQRGQHTQTGTNHLRREFPGRVQAGHPLRDSDKDHHGQRGQHTQTGTNHLKREFPGRVQAGHPLRDTDNDHHASNVQREHIQNSTYHLRREFSGKVQAGHPLRDTDNDHHASNVQREHIQTSANHLRRELPGRVQEGHPLRVSDNEVRFDPPRRAPNYDSPVNRFKEIPHKTPSNEFRRIQDYEVLRKNIHNEPYNERRENHVEKRFNDIHDQHYRSATRDELDPPRRPNDFIDYDHGRIPESVERQNIVRGLPPNETGRKIARAEDDVVPRSQAKRDWYFSGRDTHQAPPKQPRGGYRQSPW